MLLDEPSLGLAPLAVQAIYEIISQINKDRGLSMLIVEQNVKAALGIADYGYVMENGRIVLDGPADKLQRQRGRQRVLHGHLVQRLAQELPRGQALPAKEEMAVMRASTLRHARHLAQGARAQQPHARRQAQGHALQALRHLAVYSWQDYLDNVKYLALGLLALGFEPGDKLLIIGDNCPEWYFAELAAQCNRGISVGLYSDLARRPRSSTSPGTRGAEFAMVEDQEQADKLVRVRDRLPDLKTVVYWRYKGLDQERRRRLHRLRDVIEQGRRYEAEHPDAFEQNVAGRQGR